MRTPKPKIVLARINGIMTATFPEPDGRIITDETSRGYCKLFSHVLDIRKTEKLKFGVIVDASAKIKAPKSNIIIARINGIMTATFPDPDNRVLTDNVSRGYCKLFCHVLDIRKAEKLKFGVIVDASAKKVKVPKAPEKAVEKTTEEVKLPAKKVVKKTETKITKPVAKKTTTKTAVDLNDKKG